MEQHTFASAYNRLKEIHALLTTKELLDVDTLVSIQQEAKQLHEFLMQRLYSVEKEINEATAQTPWSPKEE